MILKVPGLQMSVPKLRNIVSKEVNQFLIWKLICDDSEVFQEPVNSLMLSLQFLTAAVFQMRVWNLWLIFCPQIHVNQGKKKNHSSSTALPA